MNSRDPQQSDYIGPEQVRRIFRKQLQGAIVWWVSITAVWILLLLPYYFGKVDGDSFGKISLLFLSGYVLYLPLLGAVRHITHRRSQEFISYLVHIFQITALAIFIYLMGGVRVAYLGIILAPLVTYVGMVAAPRFPFFMAILWVILYSLMVMLEHVGIIPHQNKALIYRYGWEDAFVIVFLVNSVILLVASVSSYAAKTLKKARDKAREAERMKSVFLANMSHEIRTPLNAVIGFTDMLLDTQLDESQTDQLKAVKKSGDALLALLNDILDFSKIESGELDLEEIEFDPELLGYEVCELIRPKVGDNPIEILCRIGDHIPRKLKGDPYRVRQVLSNLMSNASKFTGSGEIELSLHVEEENQERIKLHAAVRDTGIGIPGPTLDTIFIPFEQADSSTTRKYGGTGLGLSICKEISALMQGDLWAESEPGKGSVFHFTAWFGKTVDKEARKITPVSLIGKKALIVDDNRTNLDLLSHMLTLAGMHVVALVNPEAVNDALKENWSASDPFDICIFDILMPGISGYALAKKIRESGTPSSDTPLIAISSSSKRDAGSCMAAGFDAFLTKPCQRFKLLQIIESILGQPRKEDRNLPDGEGILTPYGVQEALKHSVNILVVEDNRVNQKLAEMLLTKAGYGVTVVGDGQEALKEYVKAPEAFDLILMDVQMPGMDGIAATKAIRDKGFDSVPIVAMTAHAMKDDRKKCLESGMNDYISKPIKRERVFKVLENWVFNK